LRTEPLFLSPALLTFRHSTTSVHLYVVRTPMSRYADAVGEIGLRLTAAEAARSRAETEAALLAETSARLLGQVKDIFELFVYYFILYTILINLFLLKYLLFVGLLFCLFCFES